MTPSTLLGKFGLYYCPNTTCSRYEILDTLPGQRENVSCNQCSNSMKELVLDGGVRFMGFHYCTTPDCPNFALLQVPAEDMPEQKIEKVHPGYILEQDFLKPRNTNPTQVANDLGIQLSVFFSIIEGDQDITQDIADRLAKYLGTSSEFWMNLQAEYNRE